MDETVKELLKNKRVASPCAESWDAMAGAGQVRSCERCRHKVYNLSEMTAPEAADLLRHAEGRLCVRFYRRADGTVMTRDCPVGLRAVQRRIARTVSIAFGSLLTVSALSLFTKPRSEYPVGLRLLLDTVAPQRPAGDVAAGTPRPVQEQPWRMPTRPAMMGQLVCVPPGSSSFAEAPAPVPSAHAAPVSVAEPPKPVYPPNTVGKSFLIGLPVDNSAPRADPFEKVPASDGIRR